MARLPTLRNWLMESSEHGQFSRRAQFFAADYPDTCDIPFLKSLVGPTVRSILDIPCGVGRVTLALAAKGRRMWALDREPQMVANLQGKLKDLAVTHRVTACVGNMIDFELGETVDLIVVPREAFQMLSTDRDAERALSRFRYHLKPRGTLLLDVATFRTIRPRGKLASPQYFSPYREDRLAVQDWTKRLQGGRLSRVRSQDQSAHDKFELFLSYQWRDGKTDDDEFHAQVTLRKYSKAQLSALFRKCGLVCTAEYGDYDRSPIFSLSPRMIFLLRKW